MRSREPPPQTRPGKGLPPWSPREQERKWGTVPGLSLKLSTIIASPSPAGRPAPPGRLCQLENSSLKTEQKQMGAGCVDEAFFQNWLGNN